MSVTDAALMDSDHHIIKNDHLEFFSLHKIFTESVRKIQKPGADPKIILRCDMLPSVKGNCAMMGKVFDTLIDMMMTSEPASPRLFLYVDCILPEEIHTAHGDDGFKKYQIRFHTNIITGEHWKLVNSQSIINCNYILSNHQGTLHVNDISKTGPLFTIILPGKFE